MSTTAHTIPPHLSHLPVVAGLPVPFVVARHRVGRSALALSSWEGFDLMTVWEGESGPPDFGKYDDERARLSMALQLCHVCGKDQQGKHPLVCVPGEPQRRKIEGKPATVIIQPWICAPCLGYAAATCRPLIDARAIGRGLVLAISKFSLVTVGYKPVNPEDPVPPAGAKVLMEFKILPMKAAVQKLDEWCEGAGRRYLRW